MATKNHDLPIQPTPMAEPLEPRTPSPSQGPRLAEGFPSLHDLAPRISAVDWLWPGWIPRGMLTLLGAAPGVGKSLVALDLARRIIQDRPFPDGAPVPCPGRCVLIVDAEGVPALLQQRAQAWEIDTRRLYLMLGQGPGNYIDLADIQQQILLMEMIVQLRPGLVIVDSLAAATSRGETSLHGARDLLGFLATVARKSRLPLLIIHHLRKRSAKQGRLSESASQVVADDLRGSSHISAAARSVLALSRVRHPASPAAQVLGNGPGRSVLRSYDGQSATPAAQSQINGAAPPPGEDESHRHELRRLEVIKTNICRQPPPLGLLFEGDERAVPTLRYIDWVEPPAPPTQCDLCAGWLLKFLADAGEPLKPALIIKAAAAEGFPQATLYRARQALAGAIVDLGNSLRDPHKRWALSAPDEAPAAGAHTPGEWHTGTVDHSSITT